MQALLIHAHLVVHHHALRHHARLGGQPLACALGDFAQLLGGCVQVIINDQVLEQALLIQPTHAEMRRAQFQLVSAVAKRLTLRGSGAARYSMPSCHINRRWELSAASAWLLHLLQFSLGLAGCACQAAAKHQPVCSPPGHPAGLQPPPPHHTSHTHMPCTHCCHAPPPLKAPTHALISDLAAPSRFCTCSSVSVPRPRRRFSSSPRLGGAMNTKSAGMLDLATWRAPCTSMSSTHTLPCAAAHATSVIEGRGYDRLPLGGRGGALSECPEGVPLGDAPRGCPSGVPCI